MKDIYYYKYIIRLLKSYKGKIVLLTFLMMVSAIGNMAIPLLQRQIIDIGILERKSQTLIELVFITIILYLFIILLIFFQNRIQVEINCDFEKKLQLKAMGHLLKIRKDILEKEGVLKLSKNADYCVETLSRVTGNSVLQMFIELFKLIGIIIALLVINWKLALFSMAFLPIKFLITYIIGIYTQRYSEKNIEEHQKLHQWEEDVFSTIPEIKLWNLYEKKNSEYKDILSDILHLIKKNNLLNAKDSLLGDGLAQIIFNALYLLAGVMIWNDSLTTGGLLVITSYFAYVMEPVSLFSAIGLTFSYIKPAIDRFESFMNLPEEGDNCSYHQVICKTSKADISIKNADFFYGNNIILEDVNLFFASGKKYALIGENGAGKTTLIDLLLRFIQLENGSIQLNGVDIKHYNIYDYREYFGVVTQQTNLFYASIQDNITVFGKYDLNEEIMENKIFEFIKYMPKGIQSDVGSKAAQLSGGEKQKIALARALMKRPQILILDEPTSNYDTESKRNFYNLIQKLQCTSIIISHDHEILEKVDNIILLERGKAVMFQSYEELKKYNPKVLIKSNK